MSITVPEENCPSFFRNWAHLAKENSRSGVKITTIFRPP